MVSRISEKMWSYLNEQYNEEHLNDAIYQAMANWAKSHGYDGIAHWFNLHSEEEREHAEKFRTYMESVCIDVIKTDVPAPNSKFENVTDLWEAAVLAEERTTDNIFNIAKLAEEEGDRFTLNFIQWFIEEQREEEERFKDMLEKSKKDAQYDFRHLDKECALRVK